MDPSTESLSAGGFYYTCKIEINIFHHHFRCYIITITPTKNNLLTGRGDIKNAFTLESVVDVRVIPELNFLFLCLGRKLNSRCRHQNT